MSDQSTQQYRADRENGLSAQDSDGDLFEPTLRVEAAENRRRLPNPWRVKSQLWIAFFGGSLALTVIAALNSRRLKVGPDERRYVLLAGLAGFLLTLGAAFVLGQTDVAEEWQPGPDGSYFRLVSRAIALLSYLAILRLQRSAERVHRFTGGEYASLWVPGLIAVFVLGAVQNAVAWFLAR